MTVICTKYPQLHIHDLKVRFADGVAEVNSAETIEAIQAMEGFGFEYEGELPTAKPSYDELKGKASALGLQFPGNISKKDLESLIAEAEAKGGGGGGD